MLWGWSLLEAEISCEFRMRCIQKTHVNTQAQNYAGGLIAGTWHKLTNEDKRTVVEPQLSSAGTDMRSSCSLSFHILLMFEFFSSSNNLKSPYPLKYRIISQYDAFTRSIKRITAIAVGHQHQDSTKLPPAYQQYYWPFYLLLSWMKTTHPKLTAYRELQLLGRRRSLRT